MCTSASLSYFDNGSDEFLQECVFQQGRPVMVEEVDEQAFDMGAVLILGQQTDVTTPDWADRSYCAPAEREPGREGHLIRHDHDLAISQAPQGLRVIVALFVLEANDFDDVVDLSIFHDLMT